MIQEISSNVKEISKVVTFTGFSKKEQVRCLTCGGKDCPRCGLDAYKQLENPAIKYLHSHWITDSIVAMQRPNDTAFEMGALQDMVDKKISAVFNVTEPGEHPFCGTGNIHGTGFPYTPDKLMAKGIKHFNYCWRDMTVPSMELMLNIANIACHELAAGRKIAVHCHAGFGRTGIAIACIMIMKDLLQSTNIIPFIRKRRPGSIQTLSQEQFIHKFEKYYYEIMQMFPTSLPLPHNPGNHSNSGSNLVNASSSGHNNSNNNHNSSGKEGINGSNSGSGKDSNGNGNGIAFGSPLILGKPHHHPHHQYQQNHNNHNNHNNTNKKSLPLLDTSYPYPLLSQNSISSTTSFGTTTGNATLATVTSLWNLTSNMTRSLLSNASSSSLLPPVHHPNHPTNTATASSSNSNTNHRLMSSSSSLGTTTTIGSGSRKHTRSSSSSPPPHTLLLQAQSSIQQQDYHNLKRKVHCKSINQSIHDQYYALSSIEQHDPKYHYLPKIVFLLTQAINRLAKQEFTMVGLSFTGLSKLVVKDVNFLEVDDNAAQLTNRLDGIGSPYSTQQQPFTYTRKSKKQQRSGFFIASNAISENVEETFLQEIKLTLNANKWDRLYSIIDIVSTSLRDEQQQHQQQQQQLQQQPSTASLKHQNRQGSIMSNWRGSSSSLLILPPGSNSNSYTNLAQAINTTNTNTSSSTTGGTKNIHKLSSHHAHNNMSRSGTNEDLLIVPLVSVGSTDSMRTGDLNNNNGEVLLATSSGSNRVFSSRRNILLLNNTNNNNNNTSNTMTPSPPITTTTYTNNINSTIVNLQVTVADAVLSDNAVLTESKKNNDDLDLDEVILPPTSSPFTRPKTPKAIAATGSSAASSAPTTPSHARAKQHQQQQQHNMPPTSSSLNDVNTNHDKAAAAAEAAVNACTSTTNNRLLTRIQQAQAYSSATRGGRSLKQITDHDVMKSKHMASNILIQLLLDWLETRLNPIFSEEIIEALSAIWMKHIATGSSANKTTTRPVNHFQPRQQAHNNKENSEGSELEEGDEEDEDDEEEEQQQAKHNDGKDTSMSEIYDGIPFDVASSITKDHIDISLRAGGGIGGGGGSDLTTANNTTNTSNNIDQNNSNSGSHRSNLTNNSNNHHSNPPPPAAAGRKIRSNTIRGQYNYSNDLQSDICACLFEKLDRYKLELLGCIVQMYQTIHHAGKELMEERIKEVHLQHAQNQNNNNNSSNGHNTSSNNNNSTANGGKERQHYQRPTSFVLKDIDGNDISGLEALIGLRLGIAIMHARYNCPAIIRSRALIMDLVKLFLLKHSHAEMIIINNITFSEDHYQQIKASLGNELLWQLEVVVRTLRLLADDYLLPVDQFAKQAAATNKTTEDDKEEEDKMKWNCFEYYAIQVMALDKISWNPDFITSPR